MLPFKIKKLSWPKTRVINRTINQSGGTGGDLELGETSADAYRGDRGKTAYDYSQVGHVPLTSKDATGGVAGLTLFKINFKNALNTITSFFTNANTVARTYTFQDRNGTIADDTDLGLKVTANAGITGATKTKVTYDSKGLVTSGADATTADIAASTNKNYVTDAQQTVLGNTSGANSGDETGARIATLLHGATAKTTLVDADEVNGTDSANSFSLIRTTWTNVKAFLKTYFDTLYAAINNPTVTGKLSIKTTGTSFFHYIKSNSATVASAATIDLDLTEAGAGILTVYSARISSATYRTATVYFIFLRYGSWTLTSISTANGTSGSAAFTVTNPSDNIVRVTNNAGEDVILALSFSGTMGG